MRAESKVSGDLQDALSKGLLKRIPLTFQPFVNQQLNQWDNLFPNERRSTERLLLFVASLSLEQSTELFRSVVEIEEKMGVRHWQFSTSEQTIQNSSQLASSPYFQDWRRAVQSVFDAADAYASKLNGNAVQSERRLVLLHIPHNLPLDRTTVWRRWPETRRTVDLDLSPIGPSQDALGLLLMGSPPDAPTRLRGLLQIARDMAGTSHADTWVVDAGRSLVDALVEHAPSPESERRAIFLSNGRLDLYRQNFSHEMNSMRKDLADADAVFDRLRKVDVSPWCPPEVNADPAIREFVRSLYLTGNGAVIFGNSFVQWASSEGFRRARPRFLAAQFGVRSKPKPFTGVAVFDNPDQINPLPAVDDLPGSATDAQMLALYVWLAANRYEEYQHSTVCICVAGSVSQACVVAPPEFSLGDEAKPISLARLGSALESWIA